MGTVKQTAKKTARKLWHAAHTVQEGALGVRHDLQEATSALMKRPGRAAQKRAHAVDVKALKATNAASERALARKDATDARKERSAVRKRTEPGKAP